MFRIFSATLLIMSLLVIAPAPVSAGEPISFTVMRKGDEIGTHSLSFSKKGDVLTVTIHTRIAVKILFATVYKFTCDGTETWKSGKLTGLEAQSNDNGEKHNVTVRQKDGKLVLNADGKEQEIAANTIPSTWWNKELVNRNALLDYLTGKVQSVSIKKLGAEKIKAHGQDVTADHYQVTGGLERDIWFMPDGTLVKQSLTKKGDLIEYVVK